MKVLISSRVEFPWILMFSLTVLFGSLLMGQGTRLLRNPDISERDIAFVYANDIWITSEDGGGARRLTTSVGAEIDPHFSPNGQMIAFPGQYDGNTDVYIVGIGGGEPKRLIWPPEADLVRGWAKDGKNNRPFCLRQDWCINSLPKVLEGFDLGRDN